MCSFDFGQSPFVASTFADVFDFGQSPFVASTFADVFPFGINISVTGSSTMTSPKAELFFCARSRLVRPSLPSVVINVLYSVITVAWLPKKRTRICPYLCSSSTSTVPMFRPLPVLNVVLHRYLWQQTIALFLSKPDAHVPSGPALTSGVGTAMGEAEGFGTGECGKAVGIGGAVSGAGSRGEGDALGAGDDEIEGSGDLEEDGNGDRDVVGEGEVERNAVGDGDRELGTDDDGLADMELDGSGEYDGEGGELENAGDLEKDGDRD